LDKSRQLEKKIETAMEAFLKQDQSGLCSFSVTNILADAVFQQ